MASVLKPPPPPPPLVVTTPDERSARRDLLEQIARLESDLSALFCSAYPRGGFDWRVPSRGGPRVLSLYELEALRDDLAERLHDVRRTLSDRTWVEEQNRRLIEEMMLEPERHKWVRVGNEDIGERGCKHWHVRPRWGILGMMLNWWRVRISSGCPLARRHPVAANLRPAASSVARVRSTAGSLRPCVPWFSQPGAAWR